MAYFHFVLARGLVTMANVRQDAVQARQPPGSRDGYASTTQRWSWSDSTVEPHDAREQ